MSQFEFFMTFYGLLLGLGLAELLLGFANLLRSRKRPTLGLLTPLFGLLVLLQLIAVFLGAWQHLDDIRMGMDTLALPTLIGILLFVLCVITVPRDATEWTSLDDYFLSNRRWLAGLLIAVNLLVLAYEIPDLPARMIPAYLIINAIGFVLLAWMLLVRSRRMLVATITVQILFLLNLYSSWSIFRPLVALTS